MKTRRRRHVELPPRRIESPTHIHLDTCKLTAFENGEFVTYTGTKAVTNWLKRVADLARERNGFARTEESTQRIIRPGSSTPSVRAPAHPPRAPHPSALEASAASVPSALTTQNREDPPMTSAPDRLGF